MQESLQNRVSSKEARLRFGALLRRIRSGETPLVVEKDGAPVAVLLSPANYQQLLNNARLARFDRMSKVAGLEAEQQGLSEEQLEQELAQIRLNEHRETYA